MTNAFKVAFGNCVLLDSLQKMLSSRLWPQTWRWHHKKAPEDLLETRGTLGISKSLVKVVVGVYMLAADVSAASKALGMCRTWGYRESIWADRGWATSIDIALLHSSPPFPLGGSRRLASSGLQFYSKLVAEQNSASWLLMQCVFSFTIPC